MSKKIPFEVVGVCENVAETANEVVTETTTDTTTNTVSEAVSETCNPAPAEPIATETTEVGSIEEESFHEPSAFEELNLIPAVCTAIEASGYHTPTPIQAETIPYVLSGNDIIGQAETGSGKTAAFACPLLSQLDMSINAPQVLVLAPTRELAIQVTAAFQKYGANIPGFRAVTIYGGQSYETQHNAIRRGVQVVVGTPGRVMDHLRQGTIDLSNLKTFVLDEGDEMLRMGFIDDVEWILGQLPTKRQILLFSATMPAPIQRIAQTYLKKPITISIKSDTATADSIEQSCVLTQPRQKVDMLAQILESEETDGVIVFVKTRNSTVMVADALSQRGFSAAPLNGEVPQNQRERTIAHLKSGRLNVLVATDVAARGLDVQRISHVVNFDFPHDTEAYIHRIGRTGRAGRAGTAILFVEPKEQGKLKRLQRETNQKISTFKQKSLTEINQQRVDRFKQQITEKLTDDSQLTLFAKIVSEYAQETETSIELVAAALGAIAQGDTPLLLKEIVSTRVNSRDDRGNKERGNRFEGEMTTYRIEVGRNHGVGPGNIVGAITNEANLDNSSIGRIKLFDDFSTIDLPTSLPSHVIDGLRTVVVSGQQLRIAPDRSPSSRYSSPRRKGNNGSTQFAKRKPREEGAGYEKKSYGKKPYEKNSFEKGSYEKKSFGKKPYEGASSGASASSEGKSTYEKKSSFEKKPYEQKSSYDSQSTDRKPYDKKKSFGKKSDSPFRSAAGKSAGPKKSLNKPAYAGNDDGGTKKGPDRSAKKSPMRKFVKIRASK